MNKRKFTTALVGLSLALPLGVAFGQSGTSSSPTSPSSGSRTEGQSTSPSSGATARPSDRTTAASSSTATAQFRRTSKDRVEQQFTAKDLLDKAVYDSQGERIGEIVDIDLGARFASNLSQTMNQGSRAGATGATGSSTRSSTSSTDTGASASGSVSTPAGSAGGSVGAGVSGATGSSTMSSMAGQADPGVFVSVGSVMGIGGDLVRVPIASLSYDAQEERFTLAARKAEITAIAERDEDSAVASTGSAGMSGRSSTGSASGSGATASGGYAGTSGSRAGTSATDDRRTGSTSSTTSAKEQFSDDAQKIKDALRSDSSLSSVATGITVTASGSDLVISGTVQNQQQKDRVISLAKQHTEKNVRDQLQISQQNR